jgi:hypothetical protein
MHERTGASIGVAAQFDRAMETCYRLFNPVGAIWPCGLKERLSPLILKAAYSQAETSRRGKWDGLVGERYDLVELSCIQSPLDLLLKALHLFGALRGSLSASVIRGPRARRIASRISKQSTKGREQRSEVRILSHLVKPG